MPDKTKYVTKHKSDILRNVEGKQKDDKIRQTEAGEGLTNEREWREQHENTNAHWGANRHTTEAGMWWVEGDFLDHYGDLG